MDRPILDLRMIQPNNVAHILLSLVPLCRYTQKIAGADITCLFQLTGEPFRTLAACFGVNPVFVDGPVSGEFVQIFGTRGLAVYDLPTVFDSEAIDYFPDTYTGFHPTVPPPLEADRLFVARRGARALSNHKVSRRSSRPAATRRCISKTIPSTSNALWPLPRKTS